MAGNAAGRRLTMLLFSGLTASVALAGWQGQIGFAVDWAVFRAEDGRARLEFAYGVPHSQLHHFAVEEGRLAARFVVAFEIVGLDNDHRETGVFGRRASIRSFAEAEAAQRTFVDQFGVTLPPGTYVYRITVAESAGSSQGADSAWSGTVVDTVDVPGFSAGMSMSSLQLGADVLADTATGEYVVVPNPSRQYGSIAREGAEAVGGLDRVLVYFEGYNLIPDTAPYSARCLVVKSRNRTDTVLAAPPLRRAKSGRTAATVLGVSIDGLDSDAYVLVVELTDMTTGASVSREKEFTVGGAALTARASSPYRLDAGERERKYYRELSFVATPKELAYYRSLPDSGKEAWLAAFWSRRDLAEFARRMELAETRYASGRTAGTRTDRGRVYVKYGEPDAVEQKTLEMDMKPREYWYYYRQGLAFVFVDLRGDGDFRLVYSNSPSEPKTGLESLLTSEEQDQFR
ncbi:MAG: GWxTD domain-containing protein [candidate division WOR-3 bacterium]